MKNIKEYMQHPINEAASGTASNIEIKRWVTEAKMHSNKYPVYAVFDDGNTIKHFAITGCINDGEKLTLKLAERN